MLSVLKVLSDNVERTGAEISKIIAKQFYNKSFDIPNFVPFVLFFEFGF